MISARRVHSDWAFRGACAVAAAAVFVLALASTAAAPVLAAAAPKKELKKIYARWYGFSVSNHPDVWDSEMMACPKDAKPWYDPDTWRTCTGEIDRKLNAAL